MSDLRTRRIPNVLTGSLAVLGLLHGAWGGSFGASLLGLLIGFFSLFVPPLLMRRPVLEVVGGGDIKLMAALGAWYGPSSELLSVVFLAAASGLLHGLGMMTRRGLLKSLLFVHVAGLPEVYVPFGFHLALGAFAFELINHFFV